MCTRVHTRLCSDAVQSARGWEGWRGGSPRGPQGWDPARPEARARPPAAGRAFPGRASTPRRPLLSGAPSGRAPPPRTAPSAAPFASLRPNPAPPLSPSGWRDRGGAGRGGESPPAGGSARGLGAGPPGAVVELPALRVQPSPGILNALTAEPGAPRRGALAPAARSSPPVLLLMQAALGKAPPGHRAHLGC